MSTKSLKTNRLVLRRYRQEDAVIIYKLLGIDSEITKYTDWNPYVTLEMAQATVAQFITNYEDEHFYGWAIEQSGCLIGTIGAYDYDEADNSIEIGFSIGTEFWGKGYASEAAQEVCRFLMEDESIEKVHAWAICDNIGSIRVLEKVGMKLESVDSMQLGGQEAKRAMYSILK